MKMFNYKWLVVRVLIDGTGNLLQVAEYERTAKDVNRAAYTKRIMEIISNVNKQNMDIQKVWKNNYITSI